MCATSSEVKQTLGGFLSLRTLSVGLSLAAALLLVSFACVPSYTGSHRSDQFIVSSQQAGFSGGDPVMIRIFKRESKLELWLRKDQRFELLATYPICFWSGRLGPKEREGDRQAPEGFYSVGLDQLRVGGRHPRSINIGFPNALDRASGRTGSYILLHGGCTSIGCFAMTDSMMDEIYALSEQALQQGQRRIQVQIFPFRMTEANLAAYASSKWYGFWRNLKEGYDAFEASRIPPTVGVCRSTYLVRAADPDTDEPPSTGVASDACQSEPPVVTVLQSPAPRLHHLPAKPRLASSHKTHTASSHNIRPTSRPISLAAASKSEPATRRGGRTERHGPRRPSATRTHPASAG